MLTAQNLTLPKRCAKLTRWHFDLDQPTNSYKVEQLDDVALCSLGRLDERHSGLAYRYGYMLCAGASASKPSSLNAIARVDPSHRATPNTRFLVRT